MYPLDNKIVPLSVREPGVVMEPVSSMMTEESLRILPVVLSHLDTALFVETLGPSTYPKFAGSKYPNLPSGVDAAKR